MHCKINLWYGSKRWTCHISNINIIAFYSVENNMIMVYWPSTFLYQMPKRKESWRHWFNWWENLSGIVIRNSQVIEGWILFSFPSNSDVMQVLHFCILYAKYYIYIQRFNNNTLDLYDCLNQLKQFLRYNFIYENL